MRLPDTRPIKTPGPPGFLQWLQRESQPGGLLPGVFQHVRSNVPHLITRAALHGLSGLGDDVTSTFTNPTADIWQAAAAPPDGPAADPTLPGGQSGGWAADLAQAVTPVITGIEQIKLFNTQLALAQQGRPPLNTSQMRLPGIPVNFGVRLQSGQGWILGGIAAVAALLLLGGRRRS